MGSDPSREGDVIGNDDSSFYQGPDPFPHDQLRVKISFGTYNSYPDRAASLLVPWQRELLGIA